MDYLEEGILVLATMEMAQRKKGSYFNPTDVLRWIYPRDWQLFLEEEKCALTWLQKEGLLDILVNGEPIGANFSLTDPVTIRLK
ncbi:hypothetical protein [Cyclobacterium jeungdonense]|uniref:Uncharacterized protein n=1 Tax=Cyclobacterium jeungdonense TaxID=708087 RepID=A0ABT8CAY5_9BACT|nr:hypothetical protein [Cyclobacterium jeungdonense]MDN3689949.1 hypothetical protein [Cyclobacterium jeungdonense]